MPYIRAAAATAARSGLPIMRPLCLVDPEDPEGWAIPDAYMFGPSLWVAPVLEEGATERRTYLPRGEWLDWWTGEPLEGGRWIDADAPLDRIPLWVRDGSLIVTYPRDEVARGLGEEDPSRPLEATLWGTPPLGHLSAHLADGTRISLAPRRFVRISGAFRDVHRSLSDLGPLTLADIEESERDFLRRIDGRLERIDRRIAEPRTI